MRVRSSRRALVGREPELAALDHALVSLRHGFGGVLLLLGEAGIGKTTLLTELERRALDSGADVLAGRAVPGGGTFRAVAAAIAGRLRDEHGHPPDLGPYAAALRRIVPGWAGGDSVPDPAVDPVLVLGEALLRLLRGLAGEHGCVLVLDDMHWADADSLALVEYLSDALGSTPALLAVAARDEGANAAAIARIARARGVETIRPSRLSIEETAALASSCRGGAPVRSDRLETLAREAEGLPYLVEELATGGPGVPPTLAALVAERLASLDPSSREVVQAAAVLGTDPDWRLLAEITGHPDTPEAVRAATAAQLFAVDGGRMRWRHALTRDAVSATLLPPERAALAGRAARVLLARSEGDRPDDETQAAELLVVAGEPVAAAERFLTLARRDLARGALRSAERFLDRGGAGVGGRAIAAAVLGERIRLLTLTGRSAEALAVGTPELRTVTGDAHAELCLLLARAAVVETSWDRAHGYLQEAGRPHDPRTLVLAADVAFGRGDVGQAAELAARATERAEQTAGTHAETLCEALRITAQCALSRLDVAAGAAVHRRIAQTAAEHGLLSHRVEALIGLALVDTIERSVQALTEASRIAAQAGLLVHAVRVDQYLAAATLVIAGPSAAEPIGRRSLDLATTARHGWGRSGSEMFVAICRAAAGDLDQMRRLLDSATGRPQCPPEFTGFAPAVEALPALLAGDLPRAAAMVDEGMTTVVAHPTGTPLFFWGLWVLLRAAVGDRPEVAADVLRSMYAVHRPVNRAGLEYAQAVVAGRAGRVDEATELFARAEVTAEGLNWWRRVLRMVALHGAVADGWGDPVGALRADLAEHERAGDHQLARTCRDLLRRAGAPTRAGRGATPVPPRLRAVGVTSREMDVLALVLDGLTNAQVAQRLFLSPRTVETHVASLLAKTGAASRAELRTRAGTQTP